jgi:predicted DNA binding CopG/RHH family protein
MTINKVNEKKKRRGRPNLPTGEAKQRVVSVRLNEEELKKYENLSKKKGMSLSKWIRKIVQENILKMLF